MMRGGLVCLLIILGPSLFAADRARVIDHLQSDVIDIREHMRHLKVERELLEDRLEAQNSELSQLKKELSRFQQAQGTLTSSKSEQLQGRLSTLEKGQEALSDDLKQLKKHLNDTSHVINRLSDHVEENQTVMKAQIHDLKKALESLVGLLQKSSSPSSITSSSSYRVKSGDSLEKIARSNGLTVGDLKRLNDLSDDRIKIGQELRLE